MPGFGAKGRSDTPGFPRGFRRPWMSAGAGLTVLGAATSRRSEIPGPSNPSAPRADRDDPEDRRTPRVPPDPRAPLAPSDASVVPRPLLSPCGGLARVRPLLGLRPPGSSKPHCVGPPPPPYGWSPSPVSLTLHEGRRGAVALPLLRVSAGEGDHATPGPDPGDGGGGAGRRSDALAVTVARKIPRNPLKRLIPRPETPNPVRQRETSSTSDAGGPYAEGRRPAARKIRRKALKRLIPRPETRNPRSSARGCGQSLGLGCPCAEGQRPAARKFRRNALKRLIPRPETRNPCSSARGHGQSLGLGGPYGGGTASRRPYLPRRCVLSHEPRPEEPAKRASRRTFQRALERPASPRTEIRGDACGAAPRGTRLERKAAPALAVAAARKFRRKALKRLIPRPEIPPRWSRPCPGGP